jgi:TrmH family RNA methyltransferase
MITSTHNPLIQFIRDLIHKSHHRHEQQAFVIEGVRLAEEALLAHIPARLVLLTPELSSRGARVAEGLAAAGAEVEQVSDRVMQSLSDTETSQGILAVLPIAPLPVPSDLTFAMIADAIQDPGNLGTLLRTSVAAGVQAVILAPGTVDPYAPKVLRAGMGAHFQLPMVNLDWPGIQQLLKERSQPLHLFLADANQGASCWEVNLRQPLALLVGSEAVGATQAGRQVSDSIVHIPMAGRSESLNAAVAASILIFEAVRQRTLP